VRVCCSQIMMLSKILMQTKTKPKTSKNNRAARRAAPSGGRLYPLTVYAITSPGVGGIEAGVYR
jgi:hypothetical protein